MKTLRTMRMAIFAILISINLSSCSDEEAGYDIDPHSSTALVGTVWTTTDWYDCEDIWYTISFKSDGTYTYRIQGYETGKGYYTYIYPCITLSTGDANDVYTFTSLKGSSFVIQSALTGRKYTFEKYDCQDLKTEEQFVSGTIQGHEYVDLGLSVKWATENIGSYFEGTYYAWGEKTSKTKKGYSWDTYKWCEDGDKGSITKYCDNSFYGYWPDDAEDGFEDGITILLPTDDVASSNWGSQWRIPTKEEMEELCTKCTWIWTSRDGLNGFKVKGPNGKSIFLPAGWSDPGLEEYKSLRGKYGTYWTSTLGNKPYYAYCMNFYAWDKEPAEILVSDRCDGHLIRPVTK